jgi:hypothetical protein
MTKSMGVYHAGSQVIPDEMLMGGDEIRVSPGEMLRRKLDTFKKANEILTHI